MSKDPAEEPESEPGSSGRFHTVVQPHRDLETNWAVDLAKNLEEYLLKICSGDIGSSSQGGHDVPQLSVNFAEAALLLQGSVQVYSRKVEYLYSLVLHTLEFISKKSTQEQVSGASTSTHEDGSVLQTHDEENDMFWGLDEIPAEAKSSFDGANAKDVLANYLVRPPANLVVLEGDCLDAIGDAGELESYLLATNELYRDFVLLDSCDAVAVNEFLNIQNKSSKLDSDARQGISLNFKSHKSFLSPNGRSGGTGHKLSAQKNLHGYINQSPAVNHGFESNNCGAENSPPVFDFPDEEVGDFDVHNGFSDDSDGEDPWKPLNPHEPGNLKVKPHKKGKVTGRRGANSRKHNPLMAEFPVARLDGPISTEFIEMWEEKCSISQRQVPQSTLLYEKLRESLVQGGKQGYNAFSSSAENNMDNGYDSEDAGVDHPDIDIPENTYAREDVPVHDKDESDIHPNNDGGYEDPNSHESLEDLCRSHLDSLLASLAETEKQTEMAARVSTWKQRIEENLEVQDSRPPFDIHEYGERVLEKLHTERDTGSSMSFSDVVKGQKKHDVARTFSALLQLVNNGDVELERSGSGGEHICYTAENPFNVNLLRKKQSDGLTPRISKKRAKSPKGRTKEYIKQPAGKENVPVTIVSPSISTSSCRFSVKVGKPGVTTRCTPEGKKRRKSRFILRDEAV